MPRIIWLIGSLGILAAMPCHAEFMGFAGPWRIERDVNGCSMSMRYIDGTTIVIGQRRDGGGNLAIANAQWQSIQLGTSYTLILDIDRSRYEVNAKGIAGLEGKGLLIPLPPEKMPYLGHGSSIDVRRNNALLIGFQFTQRDDQAFLLLSRCVEGQRDPFAK